MLPTSNVLDSFMHAVHQLLSTIKNIKSINELHAKFKKFNILKQLIENSKQGIDEGRREAGSGKSTPAYGNISVENWEVILKVYEEIFYKCKELSNFYKAKLTNVSIGYINRPFIEICEILYTIEIQLIFHGNNISHDSIKNIIIDFLPTVNNFFTEAIIDFKKIIDSMSPGELHQFSKCADQKILESLRLQATNLAKFSVRNRPESPLRDANVELICNDGLKNIEEKEQTLSIPNTPHFKKIKKSRKTPYTAPSKTKEFMSPLATTQKNLQPQTCSKITENNGSIPIILKIKEKLLKSSILRERYISEKRSKVIKTRQKHEQKVAENKAKQRTEELLMSVKKKQKYQKNSTQDTYNGHAALTISNKTKQSDFKLVEQFIEFVEYKIFSLGCAINMLQLKSINNSFQKYLSNFKQKHYDHYSNFAVRRKIGEYNNKFGLLESKFSREMICLASSSIGKKVLSKSCYSPEKSMCEVRRNIVHDFEQDPDITTSSYSLQEYLDLEGQGDISTESLSGISSPILEQKSPLSTLSEDFGILGSTSSPNSLYKSSIFLPAFMDKMKLPNIRVDEDYVFLSSYAGIENLDELDEQYMSAAEAIHQKFLNLLAYEGNENLDEVDESIMSAAKELHIKYTAF